MKKYLICAAALVAVALFVQRNFMKGLIAPSEIGQPEKAPESGYKVQTINGQTVYTVPVHINVSLPQ